ncbi:MAG: ABC transporter permease [Balneolaceae bacterium]
MNWNKILIVVQREYLTRVRTKVFIISTLLIPLGLIAYIGLIIGLQFWESEPEHTIGIHDQSEVIIPRLLSRDSNRYLDMSGYPVSDLRDQLLNGEINGYITLRDEHITGNIDLEYIYTGSSTVTLQSSIRSDLREAIREERLARAGVSEDVRAIFESGITLESRKVTESGAEEEDQTAFYTALGFIMGLMIFIALFMYGTIIMKGVIEEKSNRIVEVIASSIRPVELLVGKILGITGVALTQFAVWFLFSTGILFAAGPVMMMFGGDAVQESIAAETGGAAVAFEIPAIDPFLIAGFFILFILGYFIYSSLFAMVGSTVDSEADTQQMMMPIMLLIVIAWIINVEVMQNPNSTISVVSSLIPFFAPITMVTRIAINPVPVWQLLLSFFLMAGTIYGTLWFSARIYRVGILQYGKKAGFKDLLKWLRQG